MTGQQVDTDNQATASIFDDESTTDYGYGYGQAGSITAIVRGPLQS
ncbi:hypothetical protein O7598_24560 [Micromonospora sp. WMMC241]|nr:hypothetical protein [Micromonospora sp. WMMC241]MCZ7439599.1 hypothetical protein [Micromonospora sp. WMMC241]